MAINQESFQLDLYYSRIGSFRCSLSGRNADKAPKLPNGSERETTYCSATHGNRSVLVPRSKILGTRICLGPTYKAQGVTLRNLQGEPSRWTAP